MATEDRHVGDDEDDFLVAKKAMWSRFTSWSTWSIVGIAVILILMAIFLL